MTAVRLVVTFGEEGEGSDSGETWGKGVFWGAHIVG